MKKSGSNQSLMLDQESDDFNLFVKGFVAGMPTNCVLLEYYVPTSYDFLKFLIFKWLFNPLKENPFEYYSSLYFLIFVYVMILLSYYQCTSINNHVPNRKPPNNETLTNNQEKNNRLCDACKAWRPPRAIHCVSCNACTLKYDHHCPWILNCVGQRNHKAFYLFSLYLMLGSFQYCWRSILYMIYINDPINKENVPTYLMIYWIFTSIVIFPMTLMFMGLVFFHTFLAAKNLTSEEPIEEEIFKMPCLPSRIESEKTNIYDKGFLRNVINFLGNSYLFFWFPTKCAFENDGTNLETKPQMNAKDIQERLGIDKIYYQPAELAKRQHNFDGYLKELEEKYGNCNFQIHDKIYEFWKKKELEND